MFSDNLIGNSSSRFFASGEVPFPPGATLGGAGEALAGASTCRGVAASALMSFNALAQAFLDMARTAGAAVDQVR